MSAGQVVTAPVLVYFKHVYGEVKCYPANEQAEVLAKMVGQKTLCARHLAGARALGLSVMEKQDSGMLADFLGSVTP